MAAQRFEAAALCASSMLLLTAVQPVWALCNMCVDGLANTAKIHICVCVCVCDLCVGLHCIVIHTSISMLVATDEPS